MDDFEINDVFMDMVAGNDWSELEVENQPLFFDVSSQLLPVNMTVINLAYIPSFGYVDIVFRRENGINGI